MKGLSPYSLAYVSIDRKALRHNIRLLKKHASCNVLFVIKADAYGHGVLETAKVLNEEKVKWFGVSDLLEGIELRKAGFKQRILLLENSLPAWAKEIINYNLTPTVSSWDAAKAFSRAAKKNFPIHVKVDTGMGRFGMREDEAVELIKKINALPNIIVEGLCTHFSSSDTDSKFTLSQIKRMEALVKILQEDGISFSYIHTANSMGLAAYLKPFGNLARVGLMLYGLYPVLSLKRKFSLKAVMQVFAKVVFVKTIHKGESVSYSRTFIAQKKMRIATVSIGYKDGYFRALSNCSFVLIKGRKCPVLGRVTMDQIVVDVSRVSGVTVSTPVVVLGKDTKNEIFAEDLAQWAHTINYEIVCSFGHKLKRVYS